MLHSKRKGQLVGISILEDTRLRDKRFMCCSFPNICANNAGRWANVNADRKGMPDMQGCIKLGGLRTVPVRSGPDGSPTFWFFKPFRPIAQGYYRNTI